MDLVEHLADVYEAWVREPKASMAAEVRQLRDTLGLTPKGKQDRRWETSTVGDGVDLPPKQADGVAVLEEFRRRVGAAA